MKYLKLMRVKHYLKNSLVFLPIIFSGELANKELLMKSVIGFFCFSLLASVIYIMNDIKDVEKDKNHPTKKKRPIASGEISIRNAIILAIFLFGISMVINYLVGRDIWFSWFCVGFYFIFNFSYSILNLKKIPLLDVVLLVFGFVFRMYYGSVLTGVAISSSLYLVVISSAFFMGFGKRRNELTGTAGETRDVLNVYNKEFLEKSMYSCMTLAIVFYSLWCVEKDKTVLSNIDFLWTVPIFIVIMLRYSMLIEGNSDGDPINVILADKVLIGLVILMATVLFLFLYIG